MISSDTRASTKIFLYISENEGQLRVLGEKQGLGRGEARSRRRARPGASSVEMVAADQDPLIASSASAPGSLPSLALNMLEGASAGSSDGGEQAWPR